MVINLTFQTTGGKQSAQTLADDTSDVMAVLVPVLQRHDLSFQVLGHAKAHLFSNVADDLAVAKQKKLEPRSHVLDHSITRIICK